MNENQNGGSLVYKRPSNFPNEASGNNSDTQHGKRPRRQSAPLPRQTQSATVNIPDKVDVGWSSSSTINLVQEVSTRCFWLRFTSIQLQVVLTVDKIGISSSSG
jgi:hypothetical protein